MGLFSRPLATITKNEISADEIRDDYLIKGYRPPHQPWTNYLLSVFQANNQSINVWTHFIPFLIMVYKVINLTTTYDLFHDPSMRPLGAALVAFATLFLASAGAHCFCDRSTLVNYVLFFIDYGAMGIFGMGSALISHNYYNAEMTSYIGIYSLPIGMLIAVTVCFSGCYKNSLHCGDHTPPSSSNAQNLSVALSYIWFQIPIIHLVIQQHKLASEHTVHTLWFLSAGGFYVSRIPERWFPGTFDIFGHSHQLFHVCLYISCDLVIQRAVEHIRSGSTAMAPHTLLRTYGCIFVVAFVDLFIIACFYKIIDKKLSEAKQK